MSSGEDNNNNLKSLRMDKGLSIAEIAEELKLSIDVIKKLENSQFSELGAFTYIRGYLKHYTKLLGVDAQPYIDLVPQSEINISFVNTSHSLAKGIKLKRRSKNVASYILGTSILIAVSVSGWFVLKNYMNSSKPDYNINIVESDSLEIAPQSDTTTLADKSTNSEDDNYHYSSLIPSLDGQATNVVDTSSQELPLANVEGKSQIEAPQQISQEINQETQQQSLSKYTISITATHTSWVKVVDFDGNKLHNDLLQPGTIVLQSEKPIHFRIGNTNKVKVEINGEAIKLSEFSEKNIADFNWPSEG